jgi:hypothetical protein
VNHYHGRVPDSSTKKIHLPNVTRHAWHLARATRYQVAGSVGAGALVVLIDVTSGSRADGLPLGTFGSYFGFLGGIAAILILVSSMAVALMVYYIQGVNSDYYYFYDRFRAAVSDLRAYLDDLCEKGVISRSYDKPYRAVEQKLNSVDLSLAFQNNVMPFVKVIEQELTENLGTGEEFDWAFGRVLTRLSLAEESANGIGLNLIKRIGLHIWTSPVLKSFWTLAAVIMLAIIAAIHFNGFLITALNGLAIGVGCMTLLLIVEAGLNAIQESKNVFDIHEYLNSSDE